MPPSLDETANQLAATTCPMCKGAGYYCLDVPVGDPNFGVLNACECTQHTRISRRQAHLMSLSNLQAFEDKTFATFNPDVAGVRAAYIRCHEYARRPQGWLFLFGGYGCGKTHLAAAIANEAMGRDQQVIFTVVPDLLDHLRATFGPSSEVEYDQRFEMVRNVPLLVLDDLGAESSTAWAREKLFQIINHRYNHRLPTVITSNQDLDKLDPRIRSRLQDIVLCEGILIDAPDFRRLTLHQRYPPHRGFGR